MCECNNDKGEGAGKIPKYLGCHLWIVPQEVAWYVGPNHAGGYHYRLCKMPEGGIGALTEECFQQTPLEFDGNKQWINYKKDRETGELTEVEALQTREGTFPEGSMWRANKILAGPSIHCISFRPGNGIAPLGPAIKVFIIKVSRLRESKNGTSESAPFSPI